MLDLQTPIALGGKRYNVLVAGVRGQWSLQDRRIEVYLGPGRKQGQHIIIGTRETVDDTTSRILSPQMFSTFTLQDSNPPDPAYAVVFQRLQDLIEAIEAAIVTRPELQEQVYQSGEEEFPLISTFQPYQPGAFQFEEKTKPRQERQLLENADPRLQRKKV